MTWHIFQKDCSQLWPLAVLVALAQAANVAIQIALGHFGEPPALAVVGQTFPYLVWLGVVLLIAATVHQDVLPGVTQDWLARPIRRRDLMCAKILFVLIAVHVPMLVADLTHSMLQGFTVAEGLSAAAIHTGLAIVVLDLPVFGIATLTRSVTEMLVSFLAMWLVVLLGVGVGVVARRGAPPPFASTGIQWMTPVFWSVVAGIAAVIVVPLQYFRRATKASRMVVAGAVLVAPTLSFSSWNAAFSFQQWLSPTPSLARSIVVRFDPAPTDASAQSGAEAATNTALLPLLISSVEPDSIVASDRAVIRLLDQSGVVLFSGSTTGGRSRDDFHVRVGSEGAVHIRQRIVLPEKVYGRVRTAPVRAEVDYSLTLFHRDAVAVIAAKDGSTRSATFGWCRTRIDQDGDDVEVGCLNVGAGPTCVSAILEDTVTGRANPDRLSCAPDYVPFPLHLFPDALSQFSGGVKFRDPQGLIRFPVDGSQLANAYVRLRSYQPAAHFRRHIEVPELRPADWITDGKRRAR
jgi:hypothetical protein